MSFLVIYEYHCYTGLIKCYRKLREDHTLVVQNLQRQLEHVQRSAEGDAARVRSRNEAEVTDLKTNIIRLDAELNKVGRHLLR